MNVPLIILRVIHIFSGVFWAGTTFFLVGFLQPAVAGGGPEGARFMQRLASQKRFQVAMAVAAWLTILLGLMLYAGASARFQLVGISVFKDLGRRTE